MKTTTKWMLAAALAIGVSGLAATPAKAAQFGVYVGAGGPVYYGSPSPGPGYVWVNGYYANGYWIPGRWAWAGGYAGRRDDDDAPRYYRDDWNREHFDREHFDRGRDWHRGWENDRNRGWRHDDDH